MIRYNVQLEKQDMTLRTLLALGLSIGVCGSVWAADPKPAAPAAEKKKEMPTFLTVEEAGADYKVQGEYGEAEAGEGGFGGEGVGLWGGKVRGGVFSGGVAGGGG